MNTDNSKSPILSKNVSSSNGLEPLLRFRSFSDFWHKNFLEDLGIFMGGGTPSKSEEKYWNGSIPWISSSDMTEDSVTKINISRYINHDAIDNSATKLCPKNTIHIVSRVGVGKVAISHIQLCTSQDFTNFISNDLNNRLFLTYYLSVIMKKKSQQTQGTSIKGITSEEIKKLRIFLPSLPEQKKIAEFLFLVDERIEQQRKLVEALKRYKRGLLFDVFNKKIQFKNPNGVNFPKWESTTVSDVLNYEQPQKYIVASENYNDNYKTPVLTANKAFILGYTNENNGIYSKGEAIIYDDFTMDMKFATFNFKVKSSTIKILTCKESNDLYFMYNLLLSLNLKPQGHQRSYISILEPTKILVPCYEEQKLISNLLRKIDSNLERQTVYLDILENYKKGLLQQMFI